MSNLNDTFISKSKSNDNNENSGDFLINFPIRKSQKIEVQERSNSSTLSNNDRKIAGFSKQFKILLWKNFILTKRNIIGTSLEIIFPILLFSILLIIRYFVDAVHFDKETVKYDNPVSLMPLENRSFILYYPNNRFVGGLVTDAVHLIQIQNPMFNPIVMGTDTSNGLNLTSDSIQNLTALISFPTSYVTYLPNNVQYTIYTQEIFGYEYRVDSKYIDKNDYMFKKSPIYYCFDYSNFLLYNKFNALKMALDYTIIRNQTGTVVNSSELVKIAKYPCQAYTNDELKATFSFFLPFFIQISYLLTFLITVGNIVVEKESKMKEYLRLIGAKSYIINISWFIRSIAIYTCLSLIISVFGLILLPSRQSDAKAYETRNVFTKNFWILFSVFFVYSFQVSALMLLVSQLFSKPFIAKVISIILWIATSINFYDVLPFSSLKYIFCIFPNSGLIFSIQVILQYERIGKGISYSNIYENVFGDTLNLGLILTAMFAYSFLYFPISWYIERIIPGEYGLPLPFYFVFLPSYWKPPKLKIDTNQNEMNYEILPEGFEKQPYQLNATVQLKHLTKEFRTGFETKQVVKNVTINFYENQITGLLGKTTTTFMLCGIYPATSGRATILGYDIHSQMDQIRTSLGFCPQHDILYDDLNVEEHLKMIAMMKGFPSNHLQEEVLRIAKFVSLDNELKVISKNLSGGMKRRLSVGMALIGDSKVIILDEPTSGLDPLNRRALWDIIKKYKDGRTIILTTHFMEEADALSDRIAIMNHGEVKCCGSPIFLKNLYGSGYKLTVSKSDGFDEAIFKNFLNEEIKKTEIETNIAAEVSVSIPYESCELLPQLLDKLEKQKHTLAITSYGISSPTIEEVFMKVGKIDKSGETVEDDEESVNDENNYAKESLSNAFGQEILIKKTGLRLCIQQIVSLLHKRLLIFFRRSSLAIITLILPTVFQAIVCYLIPPGSNMVEYIGGTTKYMGTFDLGLRNYDNSKLPYSINTSSNTSNFESLVKMYYSQKENHNITLERLSHNQSIPSYVLQKRTDDIRNLVKNYYAGLTFENEANLGVVGYFSTMAYHSSASVLNDISNLLLAYYNSYDFSKNITTYNTPIPANDSLYTGNDFLKYLSCIDILPLSMLNFLTAVIIAFVISINVVHIGRERINGSKNLQLLSGTHFMIYWISNYIFDFVVCLINVAGIIGAVKLIDYLSNDPTIESHAFSVDTNIQYFSIFLIFSSLSWSVLVYIWSFFFKSEVIGFVILLLILAMGAFMDMVWSFFELFIRLQASDSSVFTNIAKLMIYIRWFFVGLLPNVTIKKGMFDLKIRDNDFCINALNNILKTEYKKNEHALSFSEPGIGILILLSVMQLVVGTIILVLLEKKITYTRCCSKKIVNSSLEQSKIMSMLENDVASEYERITNADIKPLAKNEPLIVNDLVMKFQKKEEDFYAVDHLCFAVQKKQCFGLLGVNGAGKTTTFKILTGELKSTSGIAYINGYDIVESRSNARRNLGFCPQFDYLPEFLTTKESLTLFAKLRGLNKSDIPGIVDDLIRVFKLTEFRDKLVQTLSGGNKRKVSAAIAFIGRPSVVILDEPTTGMDPAAKRYLWTVINKARDLGMTIVLTSHSMEECEALCTKIGIMVNGQLKCLGNIQHLKSKYGKGYSLVVKCRHTEQLSDSIRKVREFIEENIKFSKLKDDQQETLFYRIECDSNPTRADYQSLSNIFSLIEENKYLLDIETYSLSQTTLEDVFLSFASLQKDNT